MRDRVWFTLMRVTAWIANGLARVRLYRLAFWFTGVSVVCLDKWDGGYPLD